MDLQLAVREGRSCTVVRVGGELDMDTGPELQEFLQAAVDGRTGQVVLDCADVTFMDSGGLGMLIVCFKDFRDKGVRLSLAAAQQPVQYVLKLAAVDRVMGVYDTVEAAEAGIAPPAS